MHARRINPIYPSILPICSSPSHPSTFTNHPADPIPGLIEARLTRTRDGHIAATARDDRKRRFTFRSNAGANCRDPSGRYKRLTQTTAEIPIWARRASKIEVETRSIDFGIVPKAGACAARSRSKTLAMARSSVTAVTLVTGSSTLFTLHERPNLPATLEHGQRIAFYS